MANEREEELKFPLAGLSLASEFGLQRVGTTARGRNVRACCSLAERYRGGSRAGYTKLHDDRISGANRLQHLNVIVDPTTAAMLPDYPAGTTPIPDPSTNNNSTRNPDREIPDGGSLVRPTIDARPPEEEEPGEITFYQTYGARLTITEEVTYNYEMNFDLEVQLGNLIVVAVLTHDAAEGITAAVTNDAGDPYTRLDDAGVGDGYQRVTGDSGQLSLSIWWKLVATADDYVIKISASAETFMEWRMGEYAGATAETFSGFSFGGDAGPTTALSTGEFTLGEAGQMAVVCYAADRTGSSLAFNIPAPDGFTGRDNQNNAVQLAYFDDVDKGQVADFDATSTAGANCAFASVGFGVFAE
ncbi:MAG TPA: hypothetical protein VM529_24995 [Gemmata sp.]|nr:hypothetical protein [Gemmata sp.]